MGSFGDCYDNAMMESFWNRVQVELQVRDPGERSKHVAIDDSLRQRTVTCSAAILV